MVKNEDKISIEFKDHGLFVSLEDQAILRNDYKILTSILKPLQASELETMIINMNKEIIQYCLIISFVVPFLLWILLKSRIEQIFSLYLMMQLIGNIKNLKNVVLPGSIIPILHIVQQASNFQLFSIPFVKEYLDKQGENWKTKV